MKSYANGVVLTGSLDVQGGISGTSTTTTQAAGDNSTKLATTAYADSVGTAIKGGVPAWMNTLAAISTAINDDGAFAATVNASIANGARTFRPGDVSMVSWAYDPVMANAGSLTSNGVVHLVRLQIPATTTVTKLYWTVATAGASPVTNQSFVGLYDISGNRLVTSAVAGADVTSQGAKTNTVSATSVSAGYIYFALLFNASTQPQPLRGVNNGGSSVNVGLANAALRFATNSSSQTSLPSTLTLSSNAASQLTFWAAVGN